MTDQFRGRSPLDGFALPPRPAQVPDGDVNMDVNADANIEANPGAASLPPAGRADAWGEHGDPAGVAALPTATGWSWEDLTAESAAAQDAQPLAGLPDHSPARGSAGDLAAGRAAGEEHADVLDHQLLRDLQERVADLLTAERSARKQGGLAELTRADEEQRAMSLIRQVVQGHVHAELASGRALPDPGHDRRLEAAVFAAMYQAGELQELLEDDLVENIDINGCDEVWVTYADTRGTVRGRPVANSDEDLIDLVQNLAAYAGLNPRPFSSAHPSLDLRLHDGSRLSALMTAGERPSVSIRRNRYPQMFLEMLVEFGTVDEQLAAFLRAAVLARHNIMIAGATDAGKTTLLRALINVVPSTERMVVIERSLELGLRRNSPDLHPNTVEWEEVKPDPDGRGGITLRELVERSRRQNPSRVIMGEILGSEVIEVLNAMSQGNDGSLSTLHARSAHDVIDKLSTYGAIHQQLPAAAMHQLTAGSLDFIVFLRKNRRLGGRRTVTEVLEVTGLAGERPATSALFVPSPEDGRAMRDSAVAIARAEDLLDAGYQDGSWAFRAPRQGLL